MKIYKLSILTDESINKLNQFNYKVIDSKFFDNYELYLLEVSESFKSLFEANGFTAYQIGFQRDDTDFTDMEQQYKSNPPSKSNIQYKSGLEWIKDTINTWLDSYGSLTIASHSSDKSRIYKKILEKLGFVIHKNYFYDHEIFIISQKA